MVKPSGELSPQLLSQILALVCAMWLLPGWAAAATVDELEVQLKAQAQTIEELKRQVQGLKKAQLVEEAEQAGIPSVPERAQALSEREGIPGWGGVYSKPFLRRFGRNTYVGGYVDVVFKDSESGNAFFDQHRLIPFIYSDVSDRVKFAAEIEFEHGGTNNDTDDGEVKVEFATLDYLFAEPFNFRGGIVLSPLGKLNAVHDSPLQDLTERPLVDQFIIPTTLSEAGMGFYGTTAPTELSTLDYEVYLTNGFRGLTGEAAGNVHITRTNGLRNARGSQRSDINDEPAVVGRLAFSPFLGLDVGASTHVGTYDVQGKNTLGIYALDATFQRGPFELLAESAYAAIEQSALAERLGVPDDLYGYYLQGNYHFLPSLFRTWAPKIFTEQSTFTFVNRWDWINLDGNRSRRYTVGLNFRPVEETVFKTDFQWSRDAGALESTDDNAFIFSVASYF
jgi:hypothetical protein